MTTRSLILTASLAMVLAAGSAQADITWKNLPSDPSKAPVAGNDPVVPVERPMANAYGAGAGMPLEDVLLKIVPAEVSVKMGAANLNRMPVNWNAGAGRPWLAVLKDALAPTQVDAILAGTTLTISPRGAVPVAPAMAQATSATIPIPAAPLPAAIGMSGADPHAAQKIVGEKLQQWEVHKGQTLRQTIEAMARIAGWTGPDGSPSVDWRTSSDWRIDDNDMLHGDFQQAGVELLTHFLQAFAENNPPLAACFFYKNKVFVLGPQAEVQPKCSEGTR